MTTARRKVTTASRNQAKIWLVGVSALATVVLVVVVVASGSQPSGSLREARAALEADATVSVIGDSTGNNVGEWVTLWAEDMGGEREVEVHQWLDAGSTYDDPPLRYGDGGHALTVWNAGKPGGVATWAADQLEVVQPKEPDLIIFNFGHNNNSENVADELDRMRSVVTTRWGAVPLVVILQNPGRGANAARQAATLRAVGTWASDNGVPTIDVTSAFVNPDALMVDGAHPNAAGSKVWADTVADALES